MFNNTFGSFQHTEILPYIPLSCDDKHLPKRDTLTIDGAFTLPKKETMAERQMYQIRVKGHISDSWSTWFDGMTLHREKCGKTILTGELPDQTALHGILMKIRDLGLILLEVNYLDPINHDLDDPNRKNS
jgi:hypothetical protein